MPTSIRIARLEAHAIIDIQRRRRIGAARRPSQISHWNIYPSLKHLPLSPAPAASLIGLNDRNLGGTRGEEKVIHPSRGDAFVKLGVNAVTHVGGSIAVVGWVIESEVQLAVFRLFRSPVAGADVCFQCIKGRRYALLWYKVLCQSERAPYQGDLMRPKG